MQLSASDDTNKEMEAKNASTPTIIAETTALTALLRLLLCINALISIRSSMVRRLCSVELMQLRPPQAWNQQMQNAIARGLLAVPIENLQQYLTISSRISIYVTGANGFGGLRVTTDWKPHSCMQQHSPKSEVKIGRKAHCLMLHSNECYWTQMARMYGETEPMYKLMHSSPAMGSPFKWHTPTEAN